MDFNGLQLEYALEGSLNYISYKDNMEVVLEYNELKELVENDVPKPTLMNVALLHAWKKKVQRKEGFCWKVYETTLSQEFMGKPHHILCGRL